MNKKVLNLLPILLLMLSACALFKPRPSSSSESGSNTSSITSSEPGSSEDMGINDFVAATRITDFSELTSYENKTFLENGIGEATLYNHIDGDFALFLQKELLPDRDERLLKVSFFGISAPESTKRIDPWGKKASLFTLEKLKTAKTIVLTNSNLLSQVSEPDYTGSRFKALVWISENENAPIEELKCLNLWAVQEGFARSNKANECPFSDYFTRAELRAQRLQLNIWSGDDPDYYNGDAIKTSIKAIMDEFSAVGGECPTYEGKKVMVGGIVSKVIDDNAYIIQDFENEETGVIERYGMFIFSDYKSFVSLKTVGNDLTIIGIFTVRYGNPQLTSVSYNPFLPSADDMVINSIGVEKPFPDLTIPEIDGNYRYVNVVGTFRNLQATGKGNNPLDSLTGTPNGALNIEFEDEFGHKINLYVSKNTWLMKKNGGPLDRVTDYRYMYNEGEPFTIDITVAIGIGIYGTDVGLNDDDEGKSYWQIILCDKNDVIYKE